MTEATFIAGDGVSRLDIDRSRRIGIPEAVYAQGKSTEQCVQIVSDLLHRHRDPVIITRTNLEQRQALAELGPTLVASNTLTWNHWPDKDVGAVGILSGGTSDQPVVDECRATLEAMGITVEVRNDVGVAGIHRLMEVLPGFDDVSVIIAVAGMEASLPTILGGLISVPLIGVPTSVGYGSSLEGITALLSMLSSCAPGVSVVGIDNGYGAACAAARILAVP